MTPRPSLTESVMTSPQEHALGDETETVKIHDPSSLGQAILGGQIRVPSVSGAINLKVTRCVSTSDSTKLDSLRNGKW